MCQTDAAQCSARDRRHMKQGTDHPNARATMAANDACAVSTKPRKA